MTPTPTPTPTQSLTTKIINDLFVVGVAAASIFVKNPNSQQHASSIVNLLQAMLPKLEQDFLGQ